MCSYLYCLANISSENCYSIGPAVDGTTCAVGKVNNTKIYKNYKK